MTYHITTFWTPERTEAVIALWDAGKSGAEIGLVVGATRSAIIGRVHRLRLEGRLLRSGPIHYPSNGKTQRPKREKRTQLATRKAPVVRPPRNPPPKRVEGRGLRTMMTLKAHECRWPIGMPEDPGFTFCGRKCEDAAASYCEYHKGLAFNPTPARRLKP